MPDILYISGEGELGVLTLTVQHVEVDLQQAALGQLGVTSVSATLAVLDLVDHVVVDGVGVAVVRNVEENIDLLHILD